MISQDSACLLYQDIVVAQALWYVTEVLKDEIAGRITVRIEYDPGITNARPVCAQRTKLYDHRLRKPRYIDTCNMRPFRKFMFPCSNVKRTAFNNYPYPLRRNVPGSAFALKALHWRG
jgi:hypothetical protein